MAQRNTYPRLSSAPSTASWTAARLEAFLARGTELFKGSPASARALARAASVRPAAAGAVLCATGDPARELWVLLEGRVRVCRPLANGSTHSLEIMIPGDIFGLPALTSWRYPSEIAAERPSLVAALPRAAVLREMERSPTLSRSAFALMGRRLAFLEAQIVLGRRSVDVRLAAALVYLAHKFGLSIPLNRAEIGALAGTTPETTMRTLQRFSRESLVQLRRGGLRIADLAALRVRASLDC